MSLCDILKQNYTEVRKYNGLSPFVKSDRIGIMEV